MNRLLIILLVFLFGCKTTKNSLENRSKVEHIENSKEQLNFNQSDFLSWTSKVLKQNDLKLERIRYDTSKPPDDSGYYPIQEKLIITDGGKEDFYIDKQNDINTNLDKDINQESRDKMQDSLTDKQEQNTQSKPQQWTKFIWAVVALLLVGLVIYNKFKK